jgi:SAM-dependent methyltransferase
VGGLGSLARIVLGRDEVVFLRAHLQYRTEELHRKDMAIAQLMQQVSALTEELHRKDLAIAQLMQQVSALTEELRSPESRRPEPAAGTLVYRCNICGSRCETEVSALSREAPSCAACSSTVRLRSVIRTLSVELFGTSLALPDFPIRKDLIGIGLSDWDGYAAGLSSKLAYVHTHLDREPKLDITAVDPALEGTLDFLLSSEVFEHVAPPVEAAFENAHRMLKPGGVLVLTTPYDHEGGQTIEHFREGGDYKLAKVVANKPAIINRAESGELLVFDNLIFHGGAGYTVEMRVFSEDTLLEALGRAGFTDIKVHPEPAFAHGIYWPAPYSLPITAKRSVNARLQ